MKKVILSIVSLLFIINLNAQNKTIDSKPKGMKFVPTGVLTPQIAGHNLKNKLGLIKFGNYDKNKTNFCT